MSIASTLERAADHIATHGLYQKGRGVQLGAPCTLVAIYEAAGRPEDAKVAMDVFAEFVGLRGYWLIPEWNDHPDRTAAEVVAALRASADIERQAEAFIASLDAVQVVTL